MHVDHKSGIFRSPLWQLFIHAQIPDTLQSSLLVPCEHPNPTCQCRPSSTTSHSRSLYRKSVFARCLPLKDCSHYDTQSPTFSSEPEVIRRPSRLFFHRKRSTIRKSTLPPAERQFDDADSDEAADSDGLATSPAHTRTPQTSILSPRLPPSLGGLGSHQLTPSVCLCFSEQYAINQPLDSSPVEFIRLCQTPKHCRGVVKVSKDTYQS